MDEIIANRMTPMLTCILRRIRLIEEMPFALPETESVGIVEHRFGIYVMVDGTVRIACIPFARLDQPEHQQIGFELFLLFFEGVSEDVVRNARDITRGIIGGIVHSHFPFL